MRILQLAQFLPPIAGGEERHVWNLSRELAARSHQVTLLGFDTGGQPGEEWSDGVRVVRVRPSAARLSALYSDTARPHALPLPDPAVRRAIGRELSTARFDVVHAHNWIVNSALRPASRAGVPVVLTLHDYSHRCATKRLMWHGRTPCPGPSAARCLPCATGHYGMLSGPVTAVANAWSAGRRANLLTASVAVSTPVADAAGDRLGPRVVPNFIPDQLIVAEIVPPEPGAPLVFAGDLNHDKGLPVLLDAYARLATAPPLFLAGRQVGTAASGLPPGVRWAGELAHEQVIALYRSAVAVVVPSVWPDPCPTVVLEAMAAGRPVVAAASGGIVELVDDRRTGLLVPPGDPVALAEALASLLADPIAAAALGAAGRDRARRFGAAAVTTRIEEFYADAIARHRTPDRR